MNFVAVAEILRVPPELVAAAIAADNLIVAVYFSFLFVISAPSTEYSDTTPDSGSLNQPTAAPVVSAGDDGIKDVDIFELTTTTTVETVPVPIVNDSSSVGAPTSRCPMTALFGTESGDPASPIPPATPPSVAAAQVLPAELNKQDEVNLSSLSAALTASLLICTASMALSSLTSVSHMLLLSAITVFLATAFPAYVGGMSRAGGTLGVLFMQVNFTFFILVAVAFPIHGPSSPTNGRSYFSQPPEQWDTSLP